MAQYKSAFDYMNRFEIGEIVEIVRPFSDIPAEVVRTKGVITQKFDEMGYSEMPAVEVLAEGEKRLYRLDSVRKISSAT